MPATISTLFTLPYTEISGATQQEARNKMAEFLFTALKDNAAAMGMTVVDFSIPTPSTSSYLTYYVRFQLDTNVRLYIGTATSELTCYLSLQNNGNTVLFGSSLHNAANFFNRLGTSNTYYTASNIVLYDYANSYKIYTLENSANGLKGSFGWIETENPRVASMSKLYFHSNATMLLNYVFAGNLYAHCTHIAANSCIDYDGKLLLTEVFAADNGTNSTANNSGWVKLAGKLKNVFSAGWLDSVTSGDFSQVWGKFNGNNTVCTINGVDYLVVFRSAVSATQDTAFLILLFKLD